MERYLQEGKNKGAINITKTQKGIPCTFSLTYNTTVPPSAENCIIELGTEIKSTEIWMGEIVRMNVSVKNKTNEYSPMAIAKIGIPSGLSLQPYQLKEILENELVDFYEIFDNYLVFYFTSLKPNQKVNIPLDLKTELPGTYQAPASCAYLYYTNEFKHWVEGEEVKILK